jgi:predicted trehalose synthase
MGYVLDLDVIKPEERKLKLGGKEFDITIIPMNLAVEFLEMREEIIGMVTENSMNRVTYEKVMDLFSRILQISHSDIDKTWLMNKMSMQRLKPFLDEMLEAIIGSKKNEESVTEEQKISSSV